MTPYANFLYFGVLLYVAVPTLAHGLIARRARVWIVAATAAMLIVQYYSLEATWPTPVRALWFVLGYAAVQLGIARAFLALRPSALRRPALYAALTLALLPLVAAKFVPLLAAGSTIGFLGISYVTFRCLDVLLGIHDGVITSVAPAQYLAFLLFFPTISSGPIDRYRRFATDWTHERTRAEFLDDLDSGIHHIFIGFLYKFILAALISQYWMNLAAKGGGIFPTMSYMYAYTFFLFFDFAGYSAFAVGVSHLLGIHTPENFNLPFLARNIREFWDRWHISLSWWFRDHVYTRFVFAATKGHWFKNRYLPSYVGFFLSMGLMGLWHGTAWRYVIYGLYHAALLVLTDWIGRWNKQRGWAGQGPVWDFARRVLTFQLVCFGLLIFSGRLG
jgi:membrane protein involved in D-alanine export